MERRSVSSGRYLNANAFTVIGLLVICCYGCGQKKPTAFGSEPRSESGQISAEELRADLDAFEEYLRASVKGTIDKVHEIDKTAKTQRNSLMLQVRTSQAINAMLQKDDPVLAFIELWGLIVRLHQYLKEGSGRSLFGENQHLFAEMAAQFEARIEAFGKTFTSEEVFAENRKQVYKFANANPIKASFSNTIVFSTTVPEGKTSPFASLISIPMSPFRAMEGVDRTATAVDRFSDKAARFTDVVEELPESAHWQLLALLYDFEETEMAKSFLTSMSQFSESSAQLAEATKNLPQEIRAQTSILVEDIDKRQAKLQTTLDKAEKTIAVADQALIQADKTAAAFQATVAEVNQLTIAWDRAAHSTQQALSEFGKLRPTPKDPKAEPKVKVQDIQEIVEAVNQAANELHSATTEMRTIIESEQLAEYAAVPDRLVNLLTWRLGQLSVVVFVLVAVVRLIKLRTQRGYRF